jgi:phosphate acetyltransferase
MSVSAQQKIRAHHPIFDRIIKRCHRTKPVPAAVVWPLSGVALRGADEAARTGIIEPHLIGRAEDIRRLAREQNIDISAYKVENAEDYAEAARLGVELCRTRICDVLMKGSLRTDQFLQPVMSQGDGLRTGRRISHVFVLDAVDYSRPLLVTDGVVNIYPDLDDKVDIVQNAIELAHALGIRLPRVAILAAVETVNPKIVSTLHAAALCKMADRAQITGGLLDGPLGFDDAVNPESAAIKRIRSEVAGKADILVVPDLDSGTCWQKASNRLASRTWPVSFLAHECR